MSYFLPGISEGMPGFAPPALDPQSFPADWSNRPCTLPLSDSTRDTPVVMSTSRRSPRRTFLPWGITTPPARHGDEVGAGIEDRTLAGHDLVFLRNDDAALGFQLADRRTAAGSRRRGLHRRRLRCLGVGGRRRAGIVKHHQRLCRHGGVALHHLHIAGECRFLFLVAHLERRGLDLDRLVAVLRK